MRFVCLKNKYITPAVQYTLEYIFNQCGFFFKWAHDSVKPTQELLLIYAPPEAYPEAPDNILFIRRFLPLRRLTSAGLTWQKAEINGHILPVFSLLGEQTQSLSGMNYFCDLVANVYFHLSRIEEQTVRHPDRMEAQVGQSILYKYGAFRLPVVDLLIEHFRAFVEQAVPQDDYLMRKAAYPEGQAFGLALTHDVDRLGAFHKPRKLLNKFLYRLGLCKKYSPEEMDEADALNWGFDRLLPLYAEKNIKATFFFLARFREGFHFRYRLQDGRLQTLFAQLKRQGHAIGLHASRYAFDHPARYRREKKRLEKFAHIKILGMRHHYLRGLFPQIWNSAVKMDLKYDATMIHRHISGFRSATCKPFPVFDNTEQKALPLIEFPTIFFENTLPDKGKAVEESRRTIKQLIKIVKQQGGLLTILWHTNHLFSNPPYPKLWQEILLLLKEEHPFSANLDEHLKWIEQRQAITEQKDYLKPNGLYFSLPPAVEKFSLIFPDAQFGFASNSEGVRLNFTGRCLTVINPQQLTKIHLKIIRTKDKISGGPPKAGL